MVQAHLASYEAGQRNSGHERKWARDVSAPVGALFPESAGPVKDLPEDFRFHDLRRYFASLLIAKGLDVKAVQKSLRHSSAKTTLDTYGHMGPDKEESASAAVAEVLGERLDSRTKMHA